MATYWGGWGNCCCSGDTTFCISCASPAGPVAGLTVTVKSGSTVLGTCVTDATGCCTIAGLASGTRLILVTDAAGNLIFSGNRSITAGGTLTITPSCCTKICLLACDGAALACAGIGVTIKSGGTTVYTGTTDSSGCVGPFAVPSGGATYSLSFSGQPPGYGAGPASFTLACSVTNSISMPIASGFSSQGGCCNGVPVPDSMTLTDGNGSHAFVQQAVGLGTWQMYACYTVSHANVCDIHGGLPFAQSIAIWYVGTCISVGGVPKFQVVRHWYAFSPTSSAADPGNAYDPAACGAACSCISGGGGGAVQCGGGGSGVGDTAVSSALSVTRCSAFGPFSTGTTADVNNWMPDPVGGTVAIS